MNKKSYQYEPLYYGTPCQVRFYDIHKASYVGGIAFHDFIINGENGVILSIDNIVAEAAKYNIHWDNAIIELEWIDINTAIIQG